MNKQAVCGNILHVERKTTETKKTYGEGRNRGEITMLAFIMVIIVVAVPTILHNLCETEC